jgi:hypothetical protein
MIALSVVEKRVGSAQSQAEVSLSPHQSVFIPKELEVPAIRALMMRAGYICNVRRSNRLSELQVECGEYRAEIFVPDVRSVANSFYFSEQRSEALARSIMRIIWSSGGDDVMWPPILIRSRMYRCAGAVAEEWPERTTELGLVTRPHPHLGIAAGRYRDGTVGTSCLSVNVFSGPAIDPAGVFASYLCLEYPVFTVCPWQRRDILRRIGERLLRPAEAQAVPALWEKRKRQMGEQSSTRWKPG